MTSTSLTNVILVPLLDDLSRDDALDHGKWVSLESHLLYTDSCCSPTIATLNLLVYTAYNTVTWVLIGSGHRALITDARPMTDIKHLFEVQDFWKRVDDDAAYQRSVV